MGCAASTTASAPAQHQQGQQAPEQHAQQQQPHARPVPMNQMPRQQPSANSGGNQKTAPVIRSLVDLKRESCIIESGQDGVFVRLTFSSLAAGEVVSYFNVTEKGDDKQLPDLESSQVSRQAFFAGSGQGARLFLCKDLEAALEGFAEAKDKHHLVIELKADSSDSRSITFQRSYLKLNSDNTGAQVTAQKIRLGTIVRTLQALYGTIPTPKPSNAAMESSPSNGTNADAEGAECVICLTKPKDVAILHCRHVCLCRSCATITSSSWSFQCPVCRGRVAAMVCVEGG